jgi:hypothetical protein
MTLAVRKTNGIHLWRRALLVSVLSLLGLVVAYLTCGFVYKIWWSGFHLLMLKMQGVALALWILVDPEGFRKILCAVIGAIFGLVARVVRWFDGLSDASATYQVTSLPPGLTDAPLAPAPSEASPLGEPKTTEGLSGGPVLRAIQKPLIRLNKWYIQDGPESRERPARWFLLWIFIVVNIAIFDAVIVATGGATGSPFTQLPLLGFVLAGMFSDSKYHPRMVVLIGAIYMLGITWRPDFMLFTSVNKFQGVDDPAKQKLVWAVVTPIVTAIGVWQSYSAMSLRRRMVSGTTVVRGPLDYLTDADTQNATVSVNPARDLAKDGHEQLPDNEHANS